MRPSEPHPNPDVSRPGRGAGGFDTTQWSIVAAAGDSCSPRFREALSDLCEAYWYPVYAFVRRRGTAPDRAEDLTQGFFSAILERKSLKAARRDRGRFRSFLLTSLKNFLANEWDRTQAHKRGGRTQVISFDVELAESTYGGDRIPAATPDQIFEKRWALTMLERTLDRLRAEQAGGPNAARAGKLRCFLTGERPDIRYSQVARELGMSEPAVKVAVHRMRKRYGELLRDEVARTVDSPDRVDDEIRDLFAALGG